MDAVKGPDSGQRETAAQAIERLISEHQTQLKRLCYLYLHDVQLAEDAVQEAFIKAMRGWEQFRGECSEKTWLTGIAIRTCCDMRRGFWFRRVERRVTPEALPERAQEADETERELTLAVMNLPLKLREATILYYYQGMSTTEIAQALAITQPTVSNRLKRAREKLRVLLEGRNPS